MNNSARNLVGLGITSLGKAHILKTLNNIFELPYCLKGEAWSEPDYGALQATCVTGPILWEQHAERLLGEHVRFLRLAEIQKEILLLCEAAHMPVIWATQVLESLAKTGSPSRAEVTDVVTGGLAECVMLNKGPYIDEAVEFLNGTLERMDVHRSKRRTMLRRLVVSDNIP